MKAIESLGAAIQAARCQRQLSVHALGLAIGKASSEVYFYEQGKRLMRVTTLKRMCDELGMSFHAMSVLWLQAKMEQEQKEGEKK